MLIQTWVKTQRQKARDFYEGGVETIGNYLARWKR